MYFNFQITNKNKWTVLHYITLTSNFNITDLPNWHKRKQASALFKVHKTKFTNWQAALERQQRPTLVQFQDTKNKSQSNGTMLPASASTRDKEQNNLNITIWLVAIRTPICDQSAEACTQREVANATWRAAIERTYTFPLCRSLHTKQIKHCTLANNF
jgi:hypothetical protein